MIGNVVEKFILQLEAQLADRQVTIELSPDAKDWLIERGYDEQMGARPMARVIQEYVKKPLAEDLLFGRLKNGGHVRVIVSKDEEGFPTLGFDYPAGPVTPKPEPVAPDVRRIAKRAAAKKAPPSGGKRKPKGGSGGGGGSAPVEPKRPSGSVPKVPLKADSTIASLISAGAGVTTRPGSVFQRIECPCMQDRSLP